MWAGTSLWFWFAFLWYWVMLSIFSLCLLAICMSSLEKCLFNSLAYFLIVLLVFLVLSCMSCLYILEINSLSVASFAIIFSHSEGCLFTLHIVSLLCKSLIRSYLFIFAYIPLLWGMGHRGSCCNLCQSVLPIFSPRSFIVSSLTFRSLIHFEFIFVYCVIQC